MGTKILVELFNLNNPVAGNHAIDVTTIGKKGNVLEVVPPIAYSTFAGSGTGDITAVNTPAGSGLTGGAASGDVNLSLQNCPAGQVLKSLGSSWACAADNDTNSGGTVTSVGTGSGLTGGPVTTTGTISVATGGITSAMIADGTVSLLDLAPNSVDSGKVVDGSVGLADLASNSVDSSKIVDGSIGSLDVNSAQIQLRVTASCPAGQSIRQINADGTVVCEVDDVGAGGGVTAVTASPPLVSSGGATPNISLPNVIIGANNTAIGTGALTSNTTGANTASGLNALSGNTTGNFNTAIRHGANVLFGDLFNATAIGASAVVDASNKVRIGNASVTVIEGQVAFTSVSDRNKKENFKPVDGEEVLKKIGGLGLSSWNYIGHDPKQFRHYGPVAQEFFAAFGQDGIGAIGTPTTINSGDMAGILMIAAQSLEKRTAEQKEEIKTLKAENAELKARLEALERLVKNNMPYLTASAEPIQ